MKRAERVAAAALPALPVAGKTGHKHVPWSADEEGARADEAAGYHKRTTDKEGFLRPTKMSGTATDPPMALDDCGLSERV